MAAIVAVKGVNWSAIEALRIFSVGVKPLYFSFSAIQEIGFIHLRADPKVSVRVLCKAHNLIVADGVGIVRVVFKMSKEVVLNIIKIYTIIGANPDISLPVFQ